MQDPDQQVSALEVSNVQLQLLLTLEGDSYSLNWKPYSASNLLQATALTQAKSRPLNS